MWWHRQATKSLPQRNLTIGYTHALMLMDGLQLRGAVSPNPYGHRIVTLLESSLPRHSGF